MWHSTDTIKIKLLSSVKDSIFSKFSFSYEVRKTDEGHLESKERFAMQRYLFIIGKKQNMQVLSHTFTYFST